MSKINRGSGVLVVLQALWRRGSVLEGRVQVRGRVWRPHALPSGGPGRKGGWFLQQLHLPLGPRHSTGLVGQASWPDGCITGAVSSGLRVRRLTSLAARKSLYAPFLDSRGEAPSVFYSGGDEASFTSGVPHHMPPDMALSVPLLSHTCTPAGSLVKGGIKGRGDDDDKGGGSQPVTINKLTKIINATIFYFCPHFSWAQLKNLRLFLCTQKAYFSQILFTNLFKSVLMSTSPLPR